MFALNFFLPVATIVSVWVAAGAPEHFRTIHHRSEWCFEGSNVFGPETCPLADPSQHLRTDFFVVVKREYEV